MGVRNRRHRPAHLPTDAERAAADKARRDAEEAHRRSLTDFRASAELAARLEHHRQQNSFGDLIRSTLGGR